MVSFGSGLGGDMLARDVCERLLWHECRGNLLVLSYLTLWQYVGECYGSSTNADDGARRPGQGQEQGQGQGQGQEQGRIGVAP